MKSLPLTSVELHRSKDLALCLYSIHDEICIEIRTVKDGQLLTEPLILHESVALSAVREDILDLFCAKALEKVRIIRGR